MKTGHILGALVLYLLMLVAGFMSDAIFPAFEANREGITFRGSLTIALTLANLSLLFLVIIVLIALVSVGQKREGSLSNELLWRRSLIGFILVLMFGGSLFGSIYILSKKIVVNDRGVLYYSLTERKEVQWAEIERLNGNFVPGSRLGLRGRGDYAWVDFITTSGKTVHLSLRFMRGISQLEKAITLKTNGS